MPWRENACQKTNADTTFEVPPHTFVSRVRACAHTKSFISDLPLLLSSFKHQTTVNQIVSCESKTILLSHSTLPQKPTILSYSIDSGMSRPPILLSPLLLQHFQEIRHGKLGISILHRTKSDCDSEKIKFAQHQIFSCHGITHRNRHPK